MSLFASHIRLALSDIDGNESQERCFSYGISYGNIL